MGVQCISLVPPIQQDDPTKNEEGNKVNDEAQKNKKFNTPLSEILTFKNYNEYNEMMSIFKDRLKEIFSNINIVKNFKIPEMKDRETDFYFYEYFDNIEIDVLYEYAMTLYQKIGNVYGNTQNYPKEELSRISFGLIVRYSAYFYGMENQFDILSEKIIKRTNFFSENFPFKLKKLNKTLLSNKIFVFGYDRNLRLNFFIEPYGSNNLTNKSSTSTTNNPELTEDFYLFEKNKTSSEDYEDDLIHNKILQNCLNVNFDDYVTYIFFIIEHFLPILNEKLKFSNLINIIINFGGEDADTELITYLINSFNNYYPLGLGKIHIVNYKVKNLYNNKSFRAELEHLDLFRNCIFHCENYQFKLTQYTNINNLPITYGGYKSLYGYNFKKNSNLDDLIRIILSMILNN